MPRFDTGVRLPIALMPVPRDLRRVLRLWLASTSPRRRELLTAAGIAFALCEPGPEYERGGDHDHGETGEPALLAVARARRKATGAPGVPADVAVLGVDTVVDLDGEELGKARDAAEARAMLLRLCGRTHRVHTAHCLVRARDGCAFAELASATVVCGTPPLLELERYIESGQWRGKAGAYGIQDDAQGFLHVAVGSFDTVMGLHLAAVQRLLLAAEGR